MRRIYSKVIILKLIFNNDKKWEHLYSLIEKSIYASYWIHLLSTTHQLHWSSLRYLSIFSITSFFCLVIEILIISIGSKEVHY